MEVAKIVKNKFMVRHILHAHGIDDMLQFYEIDDVERLSQIATHSFTRDGKAL